MTILPSGIEKENHGSLANAPFLRERKRQGGNLESQSYKFLCLCLSKSVGVESCSLVFCAIHFQGLFTILIEIHDLGDSGILGMK